jgi:hypothetical protein
MLVGRCRLAAASARQAPASSSKAMGKAALAPPALKLPNEAGGSGGKPAARG